MKIAFIDVTVTVSYGGVQTAVWHLADELARRGHEVTVFGGEGSIRPEPSHGRVAVRTFPFVARERVPDLGSRFRRIVERGTFARHARRAVAEGGFDWIVITKPFDFLWPWLLGRGRGTRVALRSGGTDFYAGDRLLARRIDAWFANSHFNAWQIRKRYRVFPTVIYNGVDLERFSPEAADPALRESLGVAPDHILLVFAGRLVGWKGLAVAVRALAHPQLQTLPLRLLVIGDGPQRAELAALAATHRVSDRVLFHAPLAHSRLPRYYASADIGVFPSIGDEGFSNSLAEAMASGLPVVSTAFGGNPETVGNEGTCGILVAPGDPTELAGALRHVASSPELRRKMGQAGRSRIAANFTWSAVVDRFLGGLDRAQA